MFAHPILQPRYQLMREHAGKRLAQSRMLWPIHAQEQLMIGKIAQIWRKIRGRREEAKHLARECVSILEYTFDVAIFADNPQG